MRNLFSIGQFDDEGYVVSFSYSMWKVIKCLMVIAYKTKACSLYANSSYKNMAIVANVASKTKLWHNKLGHMRENGIKILHSNENLIRLKTVEHKLCEKYIYGKQNKDWY